MKSISEHCFYSTFLCVILSCGCSQAARAACSILTKLEPNALLSDGSNSARFEVAAGEDVTAVRWDVHQYSRLQVGGVSACTTNLSVPLYDDGTRGDRQADDHVFTAEGVRFDPASPCGGFLQTNGQPTGMGKFSMGSVVVTRSGAAEETYFSTYQALDADFFRLTDEVLQLGPDTQASTHVLNFIDNDLTVDGALGRWISEREPRQLIQDIYSVLPDDFDFLHLVSDADIPCVGGVAGVHDVVRSSHTGTGQAPIDNPASFGNTEQLQGFSLLAQGGSDYLHFHELMHQWAAYLDPRLGVASAAHWGLNNNIAGAVGGCYWVDNGDGTFTKAGRIEDTLRFADIELYLMGLIRPDEIRPMTVALGPTTGTCWDQERIEGPFRVVTGDDIVAVHGVRTPGPDASQKHFRMAVIVTSHGRLLSPLEMTGYNRTAQMLEGGALEIPDPGSALGRAPMMFPDLTGGRATLSTELGLLEGPRFHARGLVNGASSTATKVAPGEIVVLYGIGLGPDAVRHLEFDSVGRVATVLEGTRVLFDEIPAPLLYTSAHQVAAVVPYAVAGRRGTSVQVEYKGKRSNVASLPVTTTAPAIFTQNQQGYGPGAILNQDQSLNTVENPAAPGSVVSIYATGGGQTIPDGEDGRIAGSPPPQLLADVSATIGGKAAEITYAGAAPLSVAGLLQVNARIPPTVQSGEFEVSLTVGDNSSQSNVTVAVR